MTEAAASHVISAYALGVVVGAPLIAVLAAKINRRLLLVGLMVHVLSGEPVVRRGPRITKA